MAQDSATVAAAEKGDLIAQIKLGIGYRDGAFGEKDPAKAFAWISRAAESGDAAAQDHLGWLVENGIGPPRR